MKVKSARERVRYRITNPLAFCSVFNEFSEVSNQTFDDMNSFKNRRNKWYEKPTHTFSLKSHGMKPIQSVKRSRLGSVRKKSGSSHFICNGCPTSSPKAKFVILLL